MSFESEYPVVLDALLRSMAKAGMGTCGKVLFVYTACRNFSRERYVMTKQQAVDLVHEHFDATVLSVKMTDAFMKLFELLEDNNEHNTNA